MRFLSKIFREETGTIDFSFLGTDMHSHLIPGIDDGAHDMEQSMQLIEGLAALGYKKLITTPHTFQDYYPNTREDILSGCELLTRELARRQIDVTLKVASEYFLDDYVMKLLDEHVPLLTLSGKKVLVELSMVTESIHRDEFLFKLSSSGYEPVIAHVERYGYYHNRFQEYEELAAMGYSLQVNLLSFTGGYGRGVKEVAYELLRKRLVSYLGTDLHHERHLHALSDMTHNEKLMQALIDYPWANGQL